MKLSPGARYEHPAYLGLNINSCACYKLRSSDGNVWPWGEEVWWQCVKAFLHEILGYPKTFGCILWRKTVKEAVKMLYAIHLFAAWLRTKPSGPMAMVLPVSVTSSLSAAVIFSAHHIYYQNTVASLVQNILSQPHKVIIQQNPFEISRTTSEQISCSELWLRKAFGWSMWWLCD